MGLICDAVTNSYFCQVKITKLSRSRLWWMNIGCYIIIHCPLVYYLDGVMYSAIKFSIHNYYTYYFLFQPAKLQFFGSLICAITNTNGKIRDLKRKIEKVYTPRYEKYHKDFAVAEIYCEYGIDKNQCKKLSKLKKQIKDVENKIANTKKKISNLKLVCNF